MATTFDNILRSEYKEYCDTLRGLKMQDPSIPLITSVYEIGDRVHEMLGWTVQDTDTYKIEGIDEDYFSELNGTIALDTTGYDITEYRYDLDNILITDENGEPKLHAVTTPHTHCNILSTTNIHLPYKYQSQGGNKFLRLVEKDGKRYYMYQVEKRYVYPQPLYALAVSTGNTLKHTSAIALNTIGMGKLIVATIPYNPKRTYTATSILCTKDTLDFTKESRVLAQLLVELMVHPPIEAGVLSNGGNLFFQEIQAKIEEDELPEPISLAGTNKDGVRPGSLDDESMVQ